MFWNGHEKYHLWDIKTFRAFKANELKHPSTGWGQSLHCMCLGCSCKFKCSSALCTHLYRDHSQTEELGQIFLFSCLVCNWNTVATVVVVHVQHLKKYCSLCFKIMVFVLFWCYCKRPAYLEHHLHIQWP